MIFLTGFYGLDFMADIDINPSLMGPIFELWIRPTLGVPKWTIRIEPQLFCSSAVVWYGMCIDFLNVILWVRCHGRYSYQSFVDGSNIWGVDRTDHLSPEVDHPPLGRSYFVVVPSYDMSCALVFLRGIYGLYFMAHIDINLSSMGPIFRVLIGPTLRVLKWTIRHWVIGIW